jgi:hypothetical protein
MMRDAARYPIWRGDRRNDGQTAMIVAGALLGVVAIGAAAYIAAKAGSAK